jgi:hypothetical protein
MFIDSRGYRGDGEENSPVAGNGDGDEGQIWGWGGERGSILCTYPTLLTSLESDDPD